MLSRNNNRVGGWSYWPRNMRNTQISTKLALVYTALIVLLLMCVSIVTFGGIYYMLHGQSAHELTGTISRVERFVKSGEINDLNQYKDMFKEQQLRLEQRNHALEELINKPKRDLRKANLSEEQLKAKREELNYKEIEINKHYRNIADQDAEQLRKTRLQDVTKGELFREELRGVLMPGVILRITDDSDGRVVFNSDINFPSLERINEWKKEDNSFLSGLFGTSEYQYARDDRMSMYFRDVPMEIEGQSYTMHFINVVTGNFWGLIDIKRLLMFEIIGGMILSLLIGYCVSRKMLQPIRDLTDTARSIEVTDMSRRIEVPSTRDEVGRLAVTFNHMLDRIENGFKLQQQFVSDASHELRTPLTVIKGYADMLDRWGAEDKEVLKEGITAIRSEAEDMHALVEKLLFLARADQKRQILKKEIINMQPIMDEVYKKLSMVADRHSIGLLNNDSGDVLADKVTMKQMLRIFLENSMKYTPEGGHITMGSYRENGYIRVELADDGIGIAKEDQPKIFQRFYRVDSSRTKAAGTPGGTGLGLSIAQWIADKHEIKISLESELGKGSKFILRIPLVEEA